MHGDSSDSYLFLGEGHCTFVHMVHMLIVHKYLWTLEGSSSFLYNNETN